MRSPEPAVETQDLSTRRISAVGLGLLGLVLGVLLVVGGGLSWLGRVPSPQASGRPPQWVDEVAQREIYEARMAHDAASYGWVDRQAGVVRLPVAEAMRLVARRGIAWRLGEQTPSSGSPTPPTAARKNQP